jgi:predicted transcriptional regulator
MHQVTVYFWSRIRWVRCIGPRRTKRSLSDGCVEINDESHADSRRTQILGFIKIHPGTHLREIKRQLNLAMGVIQYHLYGLEKDRMIISRRRGLYKRFYPTFVFGDGQLEILDVLSQETERDILLFLIQNPDATQKEVSEYAQISPASVNWHITRLSDSGLVGAKHDALNVRYFVRGNHAEIIALLRSYHPMVWERWADRLADVLLEMSETEGGAKGEGRPVG